MERNFNKGEKMKKTIMVLLAVVGLSFARGGVMDGTLYWGDANAVYHDVLNTGWTCTSNIQYESNFGIAGGGICYIVGYPGRTFGYSDLYYAGTDDNDTFRVLAAVGAVGRVSRGASWSSNTLVIAFEDCFIVVSTSTCRYVEGLVVGRGQVQDGISYLVNNSLVVPY